MIFGVLARRHAMGGHDLDATLLDYKRRAAAVIVGAIGAFGGFAVQQVFRVASQDAATALAGQTGQAAVRVAAEHADWSLPALAVFIASYAVCAALTWWAYLRRHLLATRIPSLAHADV